MLGFIIGIAIGVTCFYIGLGFVTILIDYIKYKREERKK